MDTPVALRIESGLFSVKEVKFRKCCVGFCTLIRDWGPMLNVPRVGEKISDSGEVLSVTWDLGHRRVVLFMGKEIADAKSGTLEWDFEFERMGVFDDYLGWKVHSVFSWWNGEEFAEALWDERHAPLSRRACCIQNLLPPSLYAIACQADDDAHAAIMERVEAEANGDG
jgi:hypothetical protein